VFGRRSQEGREGSIQADEEGTITSVDSGSKEEAKQTPKRRRRDSISKAVFGTIKK
jgi:hypothetical protein